MDARTAHYRDRIRQLEDEIADLKVQVAQMAQERVAADAAKAPTPRPR